MIPFKYDYDDVFLGGQAINNYDSLSWSERYSDPGEFTFVSHLSQGLKNLLPEGTLISHTNTLEVMVVENHQIVEETDTDPILTITGRDLKTVLEERIVGQNWNWAVPPASLEVSQYILNANYTWIQAVELINEHIRTGTVITAGDAIPNLQAAHDIVGTSVSEARTLARDTVLKHLKDLLAIDNLGCRVIRRHDFSGFPNGGTGTTLLIHGGADKRNSVIFSTKNGDIDSADYLWSIKTMKNAALVTGKFVEQMVYGPETGRDRRVMHVDGNDLDGHLEAIPTGSALTAIRAAMTIRGNAAIKAQKRLSLSRIDISSTPTYDYRRDYNIGDIVSVDTNYGPVAPMRVVEYVEIEDENGESAYPTLEFLED